MRANFLGMTDFAFRTPAPHSSRERAMRWRSLGMTTVGVSQYCAKFRRALLSGLARGDPDDIRRCFAEEPPGFCGHILRIYNFKSRGADSGGDLRQSEFAAAPRVFVRDALADGGKDASGTAEEMPARDAAHFQDSMCFVDIAANHGFYGDVMKGDVTETEIEGVPGKKQCPLPIDFFEMHVRKMREPLAPQAHPFARNIHAEDLVEVASERLEEPSCSAADLESAFVACRAMR